MRVPTPRAAAYAWHANALLGVYGEWMPATDEPQCGFFKRRLVKDGPFVPARIWLNQPVDDETGELCDDETLQCEVNGAYADAHEQWTWLAGNPISEAEYKYLAATVQWSAWHAPHEPMANPRQPVDWLTVPTPSF